jgi:hypothetical protein
MGSPASPTKEQIDNLVRASHLTARPIPLGRRMDDGSVALETRLPLQGVQLIEVRRTAASRKSPPSASP